MKTMKTLVRSMLCLLLLAVGKATAQETFAPLISENCIVFVHADFRKTELDTIKAFVQKNGEDFLTMLGFDQRSHQATARELAIELEKLDILVRPTFDLITQELGIKELAWIADMELVDKGIYFMAVAPWKGKTDEDLQKLFSVMPAAEFREGYLPVGDFLFVAYPNFSRLSTGKDPQKEKRIIAEWIQNLSPVKDDSPIVEAIRSVADTEIKVVAALPAPARQLLQNVPLPPDVPVEVRNVLLFAAQRINWASAGISLHEILGTEPPANAGVLMTVKTARPSDARMLYGMLENIIEHGVNANRFMTEQQMWMHGNPPEFEIPPLAWQFAKGFLRTLLPDVEEDKLIFRIRAQFPGVDAVNFTAPALGVVTALFLPAVQASRGADQRSQCMNNIKHIALALHTYHDIHNAFPPLYTVDDDGSPLHSWRVLILPLLGEEDLYWQLRLDEPWNSEHNSQFHGAMPSVFRCPSNPNGGSSYVVIDGEGFAPATRPGFAGKQLINIIDGTSNTIAIIELRDGFNWMAPRGNMTLEDLEQWPSLPNSRVGSWHDGGMNVGMFDGSVRFISRDTDSSVLRALGTIAGGETLPY
ncbi:MAG: DUF1559 domain-containing protein [Planctomycetaceae bacterium]|nr:DUF1559 domain-containing protein [Planctomycetaceae bacterium]